MDIAEDGAIESGSIPRKIREEKQKQNYPTLPSFITEQHGVHQSVSNVCACSILPTDPPDIDITAGNWLRLRCFYLVLS